MKNNYRLEKLGVWTEFNGCTFNDLEKKNLQSTLTRRFVPAILILKESSPEVKYDVFDRLNTGGMTANHMEIRNAVFQGAFNRKLHDLSANSVFRHLWDIPIDNSLREESALFQTMADVQLALRFFALREPRAMTGTFRWYLGHFMGQRNASYESTPALAQKDEESFLRAINCVEKVFGTKSAFVPALSTSKKKSAPLADACLIAFSSTNPDKLGEDECAALSAEFTKLMSVDEDFKKAIGSGTNGKGAITIRVEKARELVKSIVPNSQA